MDIVHPRTSVTKIHWICPHGGLWARGTEETLPASIMDIKNLLISVRFRFWSEQPSPNLNWSVSVFCHSSQSTLAQTCGTIAYACSFRTRRSSGGRRRGIRPEPRCCWIPYRAWGSWTGGIHSIPLHPTHRSPAPFGSFGRRASHRELCCYSPCSPNINTTSLDSAGPWNVFSDDVNIGFTCSSLRWDINPVFQYQNVIFP